MSPLNPEKKNRRWRAAVGNITREERGSLMVNAATKRAKQLLAQGIELLGTICRVCRCDEVDRGRIGASSLGKRGLHRARAREHADHPEVPFVAPRLLVDPIVLVGLLLVFLLDGPRFRP